MLIIPPDNSPSDNSLAPALSCIGNKTRVKSVGSSLKRDKITFTHINMYIVYEICVSDPNNNYPALENCLFGAVKLTRNADFDKYKYFEYGIGFEYLKNVQYFHWWIWLQCNNF